MYGDGSAATSEFDEDFGQGEASEQTPGFDDMDVDDNVDDEDLDNGSRKRKVSLFSLLIIMILSVYCYLLNP
jgi:hypothetical protein